jgi:glutathione synthase/RimK-type ligase-like ATP-grasp enzyme
LGKEIQYRMIAIHSTNNSFSQLWVEYCIAKNIPYKIVNCYANNIVEDLKDCQALFWHHQQGGARDILFAKALLFSLEQTGMIVFPDFKTNWHFDDKVGQKYLLERLAPDCFVPTYVFYSEKEAVDWSSVTTFPKVFKLRGGAGSQNVSLVRTRIEALQIISKAFGKGISSYDAMGSLKERWRKYRLGKAAFFDVLKGLIRLVHQPEYARTRGNERGYVYFQDFIPDNDSDTRIIVIDGKAFGIKRKVRENDFRASGSGSILYARNEIDTRCVTHAFDLTKKIDAQCLAFDFVFDHYNKPLLVEISYGFAPSGYFACPGYWDNEMNWYEARFNPYGWMVDLVLKAVEKK